MEKIELKNIYFNYVINNETRQFFSKKRNYFSFLRYDFEGEISSLNIWDRWNEDNRLVNYLFDYLNLNDIFEKKRCSKVVSSITGNKIQKEFKIDLSFFGNSFALMSIGARDSFFKNKRDLVNLSASFYEISPNLGRKVHYNIIVSPNVETGCNSDLTMDRLESILNETNKRRRGI